MALTAALCALNVFCGVYFVMEGRSVQAGINLGAAVFIFVLKLLATIESLGT